MAGIRYGGEDMRNRIFAAALFGLAGCIENPDTDHGLATRHDRLEKVFALDPSARILIQALRTDGTTRLKVSNPGRIAIDSLEFCLQILGRPLREYSYYGLPDIAAAPLADNPMAEFHGRVLGLKPHTEADLGSLDLYAPWLDMDKLYLGFTPLRGAVGGRRYHSPGYGFFRGRIAPVETSERSLGGAFRGVAWEGGFFAWVDGPGSGMLTGPGQQDTLVYLFLMHNWTMRPVPGPDLGALGEGDSLSFSAWLRDGQSPPESSLYSATFAREPVPVFVARAPGDTGAASRESGPGGKAWP